MKPAGAPDCCTGVSKPSRARRSLDAAGYIVPGAILVLLPKCPACIVAYLAMGAGIGVTMTTAATLRATLVMVCVGCLAYLAARQVRRRAG